MIWHPAAIAIWVGDLLGFALLASAGATAFQVVLHWSPTEASRSQLTLERNAEAASLRSRWALFLFGFSSAILLLGICQWFANLVPGAMCGTGVIQSMGADAAPALFFRGLLLWLLLLWNLLEALNRKRPDQPISRLNARLLLAAVPVCLLAVGNTYRSLQQVGLHQPVNCCAVVYDQFHRLEDAQRTAGISDPIWLSAFWILTGLLAAAALWVRYPPGGRAMSKSPSWLAALSVLWIPVAAVTLVNILAAYHYEVLQHHCPWCLFLAEHGMVGYPLYGCLAVIAYEASLIWVLPKIACRFPVFDRHARQRQKSAAGRLLLALTVFLVLSGLPPVLWRLRYGVWIGG